MDIKDSYLHGTVGVVKSISVDADTLKYTLADKGGTVTNVVLPTATQSANGLLSKEDKIKLDNMIATQVANNLTLKINSGTVEDTSLYTYNGSAAKTLDIKNGSGIGFTNDAGSLQIYNTGVRSIATGTTNGTISVDTNGTTANVAVKGLGSAAYTSKDLYQKLTTYVNNSGEVDVYKKITITKSDIEGYGVWLHSRQQHYLLNSGAAAMTTPMNTFWELGTNYNSGSTSRTINVKMVATASSATVTLYILVRAFTYILVVSSGTIAIIDSTKEEYDSITSNTTGWVACQTAKWTDTTYGVVSPSANGLAPKVINTNTATVGSAYYVLASTNGSASPSWYKLPTNAFANDDTKVTQTNTTDSNNYRVLFSGNANDTTETTTARKSAKLLFNPSVGTLTADEFLGTFTTKRSSDMSAMWAPDCAMAWFTNINHDNKYAGDNTGFPCSSNANGLLWLGTHAASTDPYENLGHGHQLGFSSNGCIYHRNFYSTVPTTANGGSWKQIAYTTSDITGNAATADKLKTKRKLWGLDFDGSANVLGDMTGVGNITINATGNKDYFINFLYNSTPTYSWRLGYLGTGSGDANYFVIDSSKSSGGTWHRALQIGHETLDATFTGTVTAPTFKGNLAWSDITDKPTSYTPAAHTHNLLTWSGDVRSTATTPSDYKKTFKFVGIKDPDAVGLTTTIAGSYVSLFGWKGYPNNSGPKSWELASDNKDRIHVRSGAGIQSNGSGNENWSNWNTLAYITDNFPSNQINTLTDYTKATEASSIAATDSLNTALGKLEYKADVACDWITSVTATDTDEYINKWSEIVGFLDSVKEGTDILDEFVTRKTNLTITGLKTFETNTSSAIILKTSTNGTNINFICEVNGVVNSGYLIYRGNENYHITNSGWSKEAKLLHSNNYTSYINTTNFPGLNKTGTVTSVKVGSTSYSPSSGVVSLPAYPTSLKSPNAIKFKNTTGTEVVYDGSAAVDLTEGVYNAKQLDGNSETSYLRYRGEIDTSYVDLTDTTKNHANFKKPSPGMYAVSRTGSSEMFISFAMNAGSCSSLEFKVNYTDTSRLYIRKVIDSNRISGDWRGLAWHSDIPTKVSQLTNDSGFLTSRGYIGTTAVQASSTALDLTGITNLTMNGTYTNNDKLVIHSSGCIYPYSTSTRTAGMYGKYDSTKVGHVWSMGTDFKIADDGSSTNNMYGLVYFHTNWSNSATNNTAKRDDALITEVSNYAGGHQIAFVVKGQVKVALGDRVWSRAGFLKSGSSDNYVLLGGGGHKAISDFMLKSEELTNNLTTITKTLTVTKDWMDTGIKYTDLATGTYAIQVYTHASSNSIYYCYWSGIMTWYGSPTNSSDSDEILLHQGAHAYNGDTIYLRTIHTAATDGRHMRLQIAANKNWSSATFTFNFKKLI